MNIEEFLGKIADKVTYNKVEDGYSVGFPLWFPDNDHTTSFFIKQNADDSFYLNDNGNALSHLYASVDLADYEERIENVCAMFNVIREGNLLTTVLPCYESNQTVMRLFSFIQAVSIIANLDLFD